MKNIKKQASLQIALKYMDSRNPYKILLKMCSALTFTFAKMSFKISVTNLFIRSSLIATTDDLSLKYSCCWLNA